MLLPIDPPPAGAGPPTTPDDVSGAPAVSPQASSAPPFEPSRYVPETGKTVVGPFLAFYDHYGVTLCGLPITDVVVEDGMRRQYFQHLALEEHLAGRVRLRPLGEAWLETAARQAASSLPPATAPEVSDVTAVLPRHPHRHYEQRTLGEIHYLVIHHTGDHALGPEAIARQHVDENGWPGIGYHYLVDPAGRAYKTQDLTTVSFHARQFNQAGVGIALVGDLATSLPPLGQLAATGRLAAHLLGELGLPVENLRGHNELVATPCPGQYFLGVWKSQLLDSVHTALGTPPDRRPVPLPPGPGLGASTGLTAGDHPFDLARPVRMA